MVSQTYERHAHRKKQRADHQRDQGDASQFMVPTNLIKQANDRGCPDEAVPPDVMMP